MIAKVEEVGMDTRIAVQALSNLFKQNSRRANREKARKWWQPRMNFFLSAIQTPRNKPLSITMSCQRGSAIWRSSVEALHSKGLKRQWWKKIMIQVLRDEFSRL